MELLVNGTAVHLPAEPARSLLHVLREELGLTAAKPGCGEGACGACTVLVDGEPIRSCITAIAEVADAGAPVTTLEGLRDDPLTSRLQRAFLDAAAMQCGYCTPGMLVAARGLLASDPQPTVEACTTDLNENVCRCGTYPRILRALTMAVEPDAPGLTAASGPASSPERVDAIVRPRRPWDLAAPEEREYFDLLGDGLVVVLTPGETERIGPEPAWSTEGGGWLHIGGEGRVTAFTGKVDVGQDNRTALAAIVAGRLGVPLESVEMVMGDTDLCPYDLGTFGSRSTTDAGRVLGLCAAAARRRLLELAGEPADGLSVDIGSLVKGRCLIEHATGRDAHHRGDPARPQRRLGAADIVTGERRYGADLSQPGMIHGRVLRPPSINATLRAVDVTAAEAMPGVVTIVDGDFVAVAAPDPLAAGRALRVIQADWDEPQGPSDADLVEHLRSHPVELEGWEGSVENERGDVDGALAAAPIRLDATYTTAYLAHAPLETRSALAGWADGRLTVWVGTQRPFGVRAALAEELGIDEADVRVIVPPTGGGFGGKHGSDVAIEAARLARAAGRPVKVRWSRAEEFVWAYFRPMSIIDVRAGLSAAGDLVAWEQRNTNGGANALDTPYHVPARRVAFQPADSPLAQGSYRALSATANCFARESHMDKLADRVGLDPLDFRLRNLRDERLAHVLRAAADGAGWAGPRSPGHAIGIAGGIEKGARVAACVELRIEPGGTPRLVRIVEAVDCGRIVDPENLTNQVEGAIVMGLGGALFEAVHVDDGRVTNGSMSDYRVPRFGDVPPIEVVLVDRPDQPSAGAGETPIIAIAPAIANAVFAATGRRLRSLPLFPSGEGNHE